MIRYVPLAAVVTLFLGLAAFAGMRRPSADPFVSAAKSRVYHYADCPHAHQIRYPIGYRTLAEAERKHHLCSLCARRHAGELSSNP